MRYCTLKACKETGFTLIELMMVLSLVSMLIGRGVLPAYRRWWQNHCLETTASRLLHSLQFARNMAMQYALPVTVCPNQDQNWATGWTIRISLQNNSSQVLHISPKIFSEQHLAWHGARHLQEIKFQSTGTSAGYNGRFMLCTKDSKIMWLVVVSQTGRIRLESTSNTTYRP